MHRLILTTAVLIASLYETTVSAIPNKSDVFPIIAKVNSYWQSNNPQPGRAFWDNAAYHTGNMEAWRITGNTDYLDYSLNWAELNGWKGAKSLDKATWRKDYGENDNHVLFGDWQICFQTFADLYTFLGGPKKVARAVEVMEYEMQTAANDYWWWADGLYMVMPVMTKLYRITGNGRFLSKLHEYFSYAKSIMYDEETGLFYRDAKYVYPQHKSYTGKKDFWSRGDGWVFAGLAKVLNDLPADDPHRDEFLAVYRKMAATLADARQPEGYWTRSLLDPEHAPGYETSGTAFFTYGFLWGINNGILDSARYLPVVESAWQYLTTIALQSNGRVGYVQPIGENASPDQVVDVQSTSNFGVGAFLLACSEMVRFAPGAMPFFVYTVTLDNPYRVTVRFNRKPDPASATGTENYSGDGLTVASAELTSDSTAVVLRYTDIPQGNHGITIGSVTSASGTTLEGEKSFPFVCDTAVSATASDYESGTTNTPDKSLDGDLATRWSAEGDGQWILYDCRTLHKVQSVDIAYHNGDQRTSSFSIELSTDGVNFKEVYSGQTGGTTNQAENHAFEQQEARYVRIIGKGNSENAWNSITEVHINGDAVTRARSIAPQMSHAADLQVLPAGSGKLRLSTSSGFSGAATVRIVDMRGALRYQRRVLTSGNNVTLDDVHLSPGVFHVIVGSAPETVRLLIR